MDHFDRPRNQISHSSVSSFHSSTNYQPDLPRVPLIQDTSQQEEKNDANINALFMKGPKRKRLAKVLPFQQLTFTDLTTPRRLAMLAIGASVDVMAPVRL
jgi:hypothetical protein